MTILCFKKHSPRGDVITTVKVDDNLKQIHYQGVPPVMQKERLTHKEKVLKRFGGNYNGI